MYVSHTTLSSCKRFSSTIISEESAFRFASFIFYLIFQFDVIIEVGCAAVKCDLMSIVVCGNSGVVLSLVANRWCHM